MAEEAVEKRYAFRSSGLDLDRVAARVFQVLRVKWEDVGAEGEYWRIDVARSLFCYWTVREIGTSMSFLARRLKTSIPSVSDSVTRGSRITEENKLHLLET